MYKVGIIGTGRIGFLLEKDPLRKKPCTHVGGILKNKKLKITAACDIDIKRLTYFGDLYKVNHLYTDYKTMLKKESLDVVVIATWTDTHRPITLCAARKRIKIIICEKPMSFNYKDCEMMVNTCKKYNTRLIINHERRWDPLYEKVKKMINKKSIGKVKTVIANILTNVSSDKKSFEIDKSSLLHDGTHLIDIALYLFGNPLSITGFVPAYRKDTVYGVIEFEKKIFLFMEAGGDREYFNFELDIQGTKGRIKVGNEYKELWMRKTSSRYVGFYELEKQIFPFILDKNPFIAMYKEVVKLLDGKINKPTSTGEDGMKTIKIIKKLIN